MIMKKLVVLFALLIAAVAQSADIKFAWDASPSVGVTNYALFAHTNATAITNYALAKVAVNVGTNLTCTISDLRPGRWWFFAAAMADGMTSDPSNVLQIEMANPPPNMRSLTVQYGASLESMSNNIFFKLKVP